MPGLEITHLVKNEQTKNMHQQNNMRLTEVVYDTTRFIALTIP